MQPKDRIGSTVKEEYKDVFFNSNKIKNIWCARLITE